ncbi:MAG TPA: hypothetical protein VJO33_20110, partial [Gemmatimonadaceae bacterium]|nr:hypothetical protein [Gemmatimonadaceae bacterium]
PAQSAQWNRSQHQAAMAEANEQTVLGQFNGARFAYAGTTSEFARRDGKLLVRTDGSDGKLHDFEVKYTFGVEPLQQYLIELPRGRMQALSIAWDTRAKERSGQRWLHLYPNERVTHDDELHWTRPSQNWNFMCADCHSTGVHKTMTATAIASRRALRRRASAARRVTDPARAISSGRRPRPRTRPKA